MKKSILITASVFLITGLHSCLDFDMPTDEFTGGAVTIDPTIHKGKADSIGYHKEITEEGFYDANDALFDNFFEMPTAQYYLRGGKNGNHPGSHQYQYVYNITVDNYAGYFVVPHDFSHGSGGSLSSTYNYNIDYSDGPFGSFKDVRKYTIPMLHNPYIDSIPEIKALGLLLFNYSAQEMVDLYGAIPYVDYKENKEENLTYNTMEEVYISIVDNLDTINACFKHFNEKRPDWYKTGVQDILAMATMAKTDIEGWRLLANSLKLRMAMHIVKVKPDLAKKWAEEAIKEGVIKTLDQEVALDIFNGTAAAHPLIEIAVTWGDSRLNASFESLMSSLKHPYLEYIFSKNTSPIVNSSDPNEILPANERIVGLRAGISMDPGQTVDKNARIAYSGIMNCKEISNAPLYLMKLSEVEFLRAEGALRGWDMGDGNDPKRFYEQGILHAQVENRQTGGTPYLDRVEEYMKLEEPILYEYIDPMDHDNDIASVTEIGVTWNNGDSREVKLEKIITQKYLAGFPYGNEAWTDLRRTGYPKLFPVLNAEEGDGSLSEGDLIRKIPLPNRKTEAGMNEIANSGLKALGGSDTQATRVWWDVPAPNF